MIKALLLIDFQMDYFPGGKMALVEPVKAVHNAGMLLNDFRKNNDNVVHIQHHATRPDATFFIPGTDGAEIHPHLAPDTNEEVIIKNYPNSFFKTKLFDYLQEKHVEKLVICGMMTHMCVDATTRAAKDLGFEIALIGDACATKNLEYKGQKVNAQEVHNSFLAALNYYYSTVVSTEEYLG